MMTVRAVISGRVQGVWYRAWTEKMARAAGLDGWVRNLPDGTVEALFHGDDEAVSRMIEACRDGPPLAKVEAVETSPADPPEGTGFRVR